MLAFTSGSNPTQERFSHTSRTGFLQPLLMMLLLESSSPREFRITKHTQQTEMFELLQHKFRWAIIHLLQCCWCWCWLGCALLMMVKLMVCWPNALAQRCTEHLMCNHFICKTACNHDIIAIVNFTILFFFRQFCLFISFNFISGFPIFSRSVGHSICNGENGINI